MMSLPWTGTECGQRCANQIQFNASASSTFSGSDDVQEIAFETGGGVNPITSPDEYVLWLRAGTDTVTVDGVATANVSLYLVVNQTAAFDPNPYSGITGRLFHHHLGARFQLGNKVSVPIPRGSSLV